MKRIRLSLASILLLAAFQSGNGYHLLKTIPLGAAEGGGEYFDYIHFDPAARRVYVSHGTEFKILDAGTSTVLGTVSGLKRDHGVALVPALHRGFISDGSAAEIVMFDLTTFKVLSRIKGENDADSILYDPASRHVFAFNGDSMSATVIDPEKGTVLSSIQLGGKPEQAVADGNGMIYDNLEDKNEVIAIDSRRLEIKSRWPVAPAGQPVSIALDSGHRRLFIAGRNPQSLIVMDTATGKIVAGPYPIGQRVDTTVFDPALALVAASTGDGAISIFHEDSPDKLTPVETVKTEYGAKTMALDPKTHNLYVSTSDFNDQRRPIPGTFRLLIYGH